MPELSAVAKSETNSFVYCAMNFKTNILFKRQKNTVYQQIRQTFESLPTTSPDNFIFFSTINCLTLKKTITNSI